MIGTLIAFRLGRALDALSLGEETAITLGISLKNLKYAVLICTAFMIGSVTSVAGAIGFVGLAVPHLLRPIVGMQPSRLLLPSMLAGATLVLIADITVKLIPSSSEMKLGVLTSLIGVPFFFKILLDYRHKSL
jgi:iron complex transport system permease protein